MVSRRDFVGQLAVVTGAAALACSDSPEAPQDDDNVLDNIIVVTMENRSFDHFLGWLPGADGKQSGLSYPDGNGVLHPVHRLASTNGCGFADPNHSFEGGREELNNGACDGWLTAQGNDMQAIGYYAAQDLPFFGQAAVHWTVCDRYFTPMMGPTFPNRIISLAGQTDRVDNSMVPSELPTIWDRLAAKGLTGRNYGDLTSSHLWGFKYAAIIESISRFYTDAAAGNLPNVAFVDPDFTDDFGGSYHTPDDIRNGDAFLSRIYNAVTTSPQWKSSLLIITFDEWGGFYDHVAPGVAPISDLERQAGNTDGLRGFRIPTILISPFVKRNHVTSVVYDHGSVLKLIETRWGLAPLTVRDAQANNLADELDLTQPVTSAPVISAPNGPFAVPCR